MWFLQLYNIGWVLIFVLKGELSFVLVIGIFFEKRLVLKLGVEDGIKGFDSGDGDLV